MFEVVHQNHHLQGFAAEGEYLYWSFTDSLVKTNRKNTVLAQVPVLGGHLGDVAYYNGSVYATCMGNSLAGDPWGVWTSFHVYVYDAETLALQKTIRLDPCYRMYADAAKNGGFNGVDGIVVLPDEHGRPTLWVAAALFSGEEYDQQMLLHFTLEGKLIEIKRFRTGNTIFGIQNLSYEADTGRFWFSTYGAVEPYQMKLTLYAADPTTETVVGAYGYCTPYGFQAMGGGRYLASIQSGVNGDRQGYAYEIGLAEIERGLPSEEATPALFTKMHLV